MRNLNRLSALEVSRLKKPGRYCDGLGLWLQVTPEITKSWLFRFMLDGRARWMGLGAVHTVTLAEAREAARECRKMLLAGVDPIEARKADRMEARHAAARSITFEDCATAYIKAHEAGWKNGTQRKQWSASLEAYAYPVLGSMPVASIDTNAVLRVIEPIWADKTETARRVRGRIAAVLDWAKAREYRGGDNPARWQGHMDQLLPARGKVARVRHHPALPYSDIGKFLCNLQGRKSTAARALEFTILTAARKGETVGAKWCEIDLGKAIWIVPGERMKSGREHRVPLSDRAIEILEALPREGELVFPGSQVGSALANNSLSRLLKKMGSNVTTHGFRATFRDWVSETTAYSPHVAEMALAHAVANEVEAAYRRGDLFDKRRRLMADWAKHCAAPPRDGQIVPMRAS